MDWTELKNICEPDKNKKVLCRTPTTGKKPTRIDSWKFDLIHGAILNILPKTGEGVLFKELSKLVKMELHGNHLKQLGSLSWYTTTVKLEMEVSGEIYRVPKSSPQRLLKKNR